MSPKTLMMGEHPIPPLAESLLELIRQEPTPEQHASSLWREYSDRMVVERKGDRLLLGGAGFTSRSKSGWLGRTLYALERASYASYTRTRSSFPQVWRGTSTYPTRACTTWACSTGTTLINIGRALQGQGARLVGYDSSEPMVQRAKGRVREERMEETIEIHCRDVSDPELPLASASVITLCWTLQFVRPLHFAICPIFSAPYLYPRRGLFFRDKVANHPYFEYIGERKNALP